MLSRIFIIMATLFFCLVGFASTAAASCPDGQAMCNGKCVDLRSDEANCGACGKTCDRAYSCQRGSCKLECPSVQLACGKVCVTPASDPAHCGGCGKSCGSGEYCSGGQCLKVCTEATKASTTDATKTRK